MSKKTQKDGELSEQQLDRVAGGQEVVKMGTINVTAKREKPEQKVVKMETITVTASRDKPETTTRLAGVSSTGKK